MKRRTMFGGLLGGLSGALGAMLVWNPPSARTGVAVDTADTAELRTMTDDEARDWDPSSADATAPHQLTARQIDLWLGVDPTITMPRHSIRVVYFHRTPGCEMCQRMSLYLCEALRSEEFLLALRERRVTLRFVDFEKPRGEAEKAMIREFRIAEPSLVLMLCETLDEVALVPEGMATDAATDPVMNGKILEGQALERMWSLAPRKSQFLEYVSCELRQFLLRAVESERPLRVVPMGERECDDDDENDPA